MFGRAQKEEAVEYHPLAGRLDSSDDGDSRQSFESKRPLSKPSHRPAGLYVVIAVMLLLSSVLSAIAGAFVGVKYLNLDAACAAYTTEQEHCEFTRSGFNLKCLCLRTQLTH
jgi:hypothetical protein